MGEALHPSVEWAQRAHLVFITVNVTDCENPEIKVKKDTLYFKGRGGPDNKLFETKLNLFGEIKKKTVKYTVRPRCIEFTLKKVERGHNWSRLLADKTKQHWLKPDFSKWKDEDDWSDEDVSTDEDESTDDDESTDEDEDKFTDVEKHTGNPPPEDFAEQMLDVIQAHLDALLRGEWSNRSALLYLGYEELGKVLADIPRPEQEDLGKYDSFVEALDNLQPFVDFLEREGVDSQSSQSERLKEWLTGLGLTGHNLGEERGNLEAMGAFCDNSGRINQPTRHGEGVRDLEDKMRNMSSLGSGIPELLDAWSTAASK